jgi:hypothetical protein
MIGVDVWPTVKLPNQAKGLIYCGCFSAGKTPESNQRFDHACIITKSYLIGYDERDFNPQNQFLEQEPYEHFSNE